MILRKPYVFFIKMFKPLHILISAILFYLIYITNNVLSFFTEYIYSTNSVVGQNLKGTIGSNLLFIIPIIIIIFCIIFLIILFKKKKPVTFYVINIIVFIVVLIISVYCYNFLGVMEENVVSIKLAKLNHDLILINMAVEIVIFIPFVVRGLGINFKKFNFDSDIAKIDISEADKEEIEVSVGIDLDEGKRKRKKQLRYLIYLYKEKKFLINLISIVLFVIIVVLLIVNNFNKYGKEGTIYNLGKANFKVNETLMVTESFNESKITDNYLIVVNVSLQSFNSSSLYLKDFSLNIGEVNFKPQIKYSNYLLDIGTVYNENALTNEYDNYLLVFEVQEKFIDSDFILIYTTEGNITEIKLNPKELVNNEKSISKQIGENINFNETLGNIEFNISDFEIKNKFLLEYQFCAEKNDCYLSKEYIKATINENFDKSVLRLNVNYVNESDLNMSNFYKFFNGFGIISYKIGNVWYSQKTDFEEIKSKKVKSGNNIYIGINSEIINASSIKMIFNIRGSKYEYIIK